jgi:hypothetical protein
MNVTSSNVVSKESLENRPTMAAEGSTVQPAATIDSNDDPVKAQQHESHLDLQDSKMTPKTTFPWLPSVCVASLMLVVLIVSFVFFHHRYTKRKRAAAMRAVELEEYLHSKNEPETGIQESSLGFSSSCVRQEDMSSRAESWSVHDFEQYIGQNNDPDPGELDSHDNISLHFMPTHDAVFTVSSETMETCADDIESHSSAHKDAIVPELTAKDAKPSLSTSDTFSNPRNSLTPDSKGTAFTPTVYEKCSRPDEVPGVQSIEEFEETDIKTTRSAVCVESKEESRLVSSNSETKPLTVLNGEEGLGLYGAGEVPMFDGQDLHGQFSEGLAPLCIVCLVSQARQRPLFVCTHCFSRNDERGVSHSVSLSDTCSATVERETSPLPNDSQAGRQDQFAVTAACSIDNDMIVQRSSSTHNDMTVRRNSSTQETYHPQGLKNRLQQNYTPTDIYDPSHHADSTLDSNFEYNSASDNEYRRGDRPLTDRNESFFIESQEYSTETQLHTDELETDNTRFSHNDVSLQLSAESVVENDNVAATHSDATSKRFSTVTSVEIAGSADTNSPDMYGKYTKRCCRRP